MTNSDVISNIHIFRKTVFALSSNAVNNRPILDIAFESHFDLILVA